MGPGADPGIATSGPTVSSVRHRPRHGARAFIEDQPAGQWRPTGPQRPISGPDRPVPCMHVPPDSSDAGGFRQRGQRIIRTHPALHHRPVRRPLWCPATRSGRRCNAAGKHTRRPRPCFAKTTGFARAEQAERARGEIAGQGRRAAIAQPPSGERAADPPPAGAAMARAPGHAAREMRMPHRRRPAVQRQRVVRRPLRLGGWGCERALEGCRRVRDRGRAAPDPGTRRTSANSLRGPSRQQHELRRLWSVKRTGRTGVAMTSAACGDSSRALTGQPAHRMRQRRPVSPKARVPRPGPWFCRTREEQDRRQGQPSSPPQHARWPEDLRPWNRNPLLQHGHLFHGAGVGKIYRDKPLAPGVGCCRP